MPITLESNPQSIIRAPGFSVGSKWAWRLGAACLILGVVAVRLLYLANACPLDLAPDEAHYWDWSRHLDWSYYSKGPLVAYAIRLGCWAAGDWSRQLTGNEMLAVRLPAVLCGALLLTSLYILTLQVFRREGLALGVVVAALTLPIVAAGSTLMTIDAPYTCCWGWALVFGYRAVFRESSWAWPALGLTIGLGMLAKYTMVLWLPSVALFLLFSPKYRHLLWTKGFWIMTGLAGLCCLPILVWNAEHGWVTFHHVSGQAGLSDSQGMRWLGPLEYVGMQFALFLGYWFVVWAAAMVRFRPWRSSQPEADYLWWMSITTFAVFFGFSVISDEEPNWPVTAYLSGLVLAAAWIAEQVRSPSRSYRRLAMGCLAGAAVLGLALTLSIHHGDWLQPLLLRVSGTATVKQPAPLRRFDPTCRLRGWQKLASAVDEMRKELGEKTVLAATSWTLPGELGFYCDGHPTVYSIGLVLGDRHSQYDFWRPNPLADGELFHGQDIIIVGELNPAVAEAFEQIEPTRAVIYREHGQPIADWQVTICRGFRGFKTPVQATHF